MDQTVATFYLFAKLDDCESFRELLQKECNESDVLGTIILATEGINATIAGPKEGVEAVLAFIRSDKLLA